MGGCGFGPGSFVGHGQHSPLSIFLPHAHCALADSGNPNSNTAINDALIFARLCRIDVPPVFEDAELEYLAIARNLTCARHQDLSTKPRFARAPPDPV